jgi:large subunit ribosomal protein L5e
MVFIKVVKNKAYFKRFQVKYRRRREGKTDYRQRQRLITQDKTKFNVPKYRFVVRITNKDVICQVVSSKIVGDQVLCAAYSHELTKYGLKVGLSNYSAAYCTGLLLARRLLQKLGLDKKYEGITETDGNKFLVEHKSGARPFKAYADLGVARTTTGARIFGAIKGACDGGLYIPHSNKRFPGYNKESGEFDPAVHRDRIYGAHVSKYMAELSKSDPESYKKQFSKYIEAGIKADGIEALYKKVHAAIRADPKFVKKEAKTVEAKRFSRAKLDVKTRHDRAEAKKKKMLVKRAAIEAERRAKKKAQVKKEEEAPEEAPVEEKKDAKGGKADAKAPAKADAKAPAKGDAKAPAKADAKAPAMDAKNK